MLKTPRCAKKMKAAAISLPAGCLGFEHTAGGGKKFTRSKTKVKAFIKPYTKLTMQT
jgi:hypothetical protein